MENPQFKGTLAEYKVAVDLMSQGYFVFVQATHCSPFDLVAERDGQLLKIEVRSGTYSKTGRIYGIPSKKIHDVVLAIVLPDQILYLPDLDYKALE